MEDKRKLDDLIKSSFDKISKGAPDELWGKLSSALDADALSPSSTNEEADSPLDAKVKESFSSLNRKAPNHIWAAINRQLNIERAWEGISNELDKTKPLFEPKTWIAAAVLLLLLLSTGISIIFSREVVLPAGADRQEKETREFGESFVSSKSEEVKATKEQKTRSLGQPANSGKDVTEYKRSVTANDGSDKKDQYGHSSEEGNKSNQKRVLKGISEHKKESFPDQPDAFLQSSLHTSTDKNTSDAKRMPANNNTGRGATKNLNEGLLQSFEHKKNPEAFGAVNRLSREQLSTSKILSLNVSGLPLIPEEVAIPIKLETMPLDTLPIFQMAVKPIHEKEEKEFLNIRNFETGPVWVYHNSWLLNNETKNSFDKNSLISTAPTYKQNWGLSFNYKFTGRSSLATEFHFYSKAGQQYKMFSEGEYLKKGLELRYHKLYLQYQRNFIERGKNVPNWFTVKAGLYGSLLQEKLGEIRQEESRYTSLDYGFRAALGQENKLGRFVVGYGLSTERGLKNVFGGTEKLPATFNKTYLQNFGTYLNLRYGF